MRFHEIVRPYRFNQTIKKAKATLHRVERLRASGVPEKAEDKLRLAANNIILAIKILETPSD